MKSKQIKILILVFFLMLVIGGGFILSTFIGRNSVKKSGYKTDYNPVYIDSMVKEKTKKP